MINKYCPMGTHYWEGKQLHSIVICILLFQYTEWTNDNDNKL
jgi:endonuclease III-like uncharacterized protein